MTSSLFTPDITPSFEGASIRKMHDTYSADILAMHSTIRPPFAWAGSEWVCTGSGPSTLDLYRVVELADFAGPTTTYSDKTLVEAGNHARNDPSGFYHGMRVTSGRRQLVMHGPRLQAPYTSADDLYGDGWRTRTVESDGTPTLKGEGMDLVYCEGCEVELSQLDHYWDKGECGKFCEDCAGCHLKVCVRCWDEFMDDCTANPADTETPILAHQLVPALPGFAGAVAEQAEAAAVQHGADLTADLLQPLADITRTTGKLESLSPLFRGSDADSQLSLF